MTQIQIQYQSMLETKRHDVATERQEANELVETSKHNRATEGETKRHNVATENEARRHNVKTEGLTKQQNDETKRHNVATETEAKRANKAKEAENVRSHKAAEAENVRSHKATESINRTIANAKAVESRAKANKYNADAVATNLTNALRKANPNMDWVNTFGKNFDKKIANALAVTATVMDQAGLSSSDVINEAAKAVKVVHDSTGKFAVSYTNPDSLATRFLNNHRNDPRYSKVSHKDMTKAFEDVLNSIGDTLVGGPLTAPTGKRNVK